MRRRRSLPIFRCELDANAEVGPHVEFFGGAGDDVEFVELLHDDEDALSHLLRQQCQLNVALIFISVADDERVALALHGDDGMQFGLRAGLESEVELASVAHNLLHHRLHLIDLDGIDDEVFALIVVLFRCFSEAVEGFFYSAVENVGKTQQCRCADVAQGQFVHYFAEVDAGTALDGCHADIAFFVDVEVGASPAADVVEFAGIFNGPFFHSRSGEFEEGMFGEGLVLQDVLECLDCLVNLVNCQLRNLLLQYSQ